MHFEQRRPVIERGAAAEARDAVADLAANAGADRIDAVLEPAIRIEPQVGGGKPQPAPAPVAGDDRAGRDRWMADELGGLDPAAGGERGADRARGDRPPLVFERRQDLDREAEPLALGRKKAGRAAPVPAVMEIEGDG